MTVIGALDYRLEELRRWRDAWDALCGASDFDAQSIERIDAALARATIELRRLRQQAEAVVGSS